MKSKHVIAAITAAFLFSAPPTYAASDDECAIWLCLPTGFPSGCGDAKSAFKKRIKKFKPPLPSFSSCLFSGDLPASTPSNDTDMSAKDGRAAYIPPRSVCAEYGSYCTRYEIVPSQILKNTSCHIDKDRNSTPKYCTRTIRYVETFQNGQQYGETHYFDHAGNTYFEGVTAP